MVHSRTVHLPLGALLSPCIPCVAQVPLQDQRTGEPFLKKLPEDSVVWEKGHWMTRGEVTRREELCSRRRLQL